MSEKNSVLQINFQWEKLARTYLGQIISCTGKENIANDVRKKILPSICQGKEVWEKHSYPN